VGTTAKLLAFTAHLSFEHVIALEYLLAAVELISQVRGSSTELDALRERTRRVLSRSVAD